MGEQIKEFEQRILKVWGEGISDAENSESKAMQKHCGVGKEELLLIKEENA